jgi:hypothetical protein
MRLIRKCAACFMVLSFSNKLRSDMGLAEVCPVSGRFPIRSVAIRPSSEREESKRDGIVCQVMATARGALAFARICKREVRPSKGFFRLRHVSSLSRRLTFQNQSEPFGELKRVDANSSESLAGFDQALVKVKPIHELLFRHFPCRATFNDLSKSVVIFRKVDRVF